MSMEIFPFISIYLPYVIPYTCIPVFYFNNLQKNLVVHVHALYIMMLQLQRDRDRKGSAMEIQEQSNK